MNKVEGFTLVELLVTTSIIGVIGLAVFSAFISGIKIYERTQAYGKQYGEIAISLEEIEKNLRNTVNVERMKFDGTSEGIFFPGFVSDSYNESGLGRLSLGRIGYFFDNDKERLFKVARGYVDTINEKPAEENQIRLAFSARSVEFSYFYFDKELESYQWKESWDGDEEIGLPLGVRIKVVFEDDGHDLSLDRTILLPVAAQ